MPHVQLRGAVRVADLAAPLADFMEAQPPEVRKIQGAFLALDRRHLLLEAVVVEAYLRQSFFLLLREEEEGLLIRCHPVGTPQKTDGVKRLIAAVARRCRALRPDLVVGNTNLEALL
ncbi:MAG: hypothetical protein FJY75_02665 [Candidatus Eisenbacteria bacterium]|uniref:Uncharacterized protein n=1 Tax=Eiseniibacteriota bacterium TaxID=2212470 RepID=A0A937X9L3_UNCEI|nr:hypothetical protein [Candidatus Eisenbacteria bacterium]